MPGIKTNIFLKEHTSFRIGGPAKYFFEAKTAKELIQAIKAAKKIGLPFFIFGRGSNILVSDQGYPGLMIKMAATDCEIKGEEIISEAGMALASLVSRSIENGLAGLEWAVGIPGTIGGAIYGNSGAFGKAMADIVKSVMVFDTRTQRTRKFKNKNCQFAYKESIFKHKRNLVILAAEIELRRGNCKEIPEKMRRYLRYRREKQPLDFPSAGSVFKNIEAKKFFSKNSFQKLKKKFPQLEEFVKKGQVPAGFLIESAGLKGKRIGKAQISEKHANFIINLGEARAKDVLKLITLIKKSLKKRYKVVLEEEIRCLGF